MNMFVATYLQKTPFTPADEETLSSHGFFDTGIKVTDEEGNSLMRLAKNGDTFRLKGKNEYSVKIRNLVRHNAHKINFTLERV